MSHITPNTSSRTHCWRTLITKIAAIALIIFAPLALAGSQNPDLNAALAALNASTEANSTDYGQTLINIIAHSHPDGEQAGGSLMSHIAFGLTAISLVMMAFLAGFGGVNYIIQTANKGKAGGQVISSFWMPMRIAVASILLVPIGVGYSTIHYGIIWIAEAGSNHANYLVRNGIDYIASEGSYNPIIADNTHLIQGLVASELCMYYINTHEKKSSISAKPIYSSHVSTTDNATTSKNPGIIGIDYVREGSKFRGESSSYCGGFKFEEATTGNLKDRTLGFFSREWRRAGGKFETSPTKIDSNLGVNQDDYELGTINSNNAIKAATGIIIRDEIIPIAREIALKLASDQSHLEAMKKNGLSFQQRFEEAAAAATLTSLGVAQEMNALNDKLNGQIKQLIIKTVNDRTKALSSNNESDTWFDEIKEVGWPALGSIFWQNMKRQSMINAMTSAAQATYMPSTEESDYGDDTRYHSIIYRYNKAVEFQTKTHRPAQPNITSVSFTGLEGNTGSAKSIFTSFFENLTTTVLQPDQDGDLMTHLQTVGSRITVTVDNSIHAIIWGSSVFKAGVKFIERMQEAASKAGSAVPFVGGGYEAGVKMAGAGVLLPLEIMSGAIDQYIQYFKILAIPLLLAGFTLAVVLPAIPMMFWLLGVISYMLFFVECLLVSTFWLAAHGTAEKEGWGSEHTRQGYMLMIGLYLNPILRVAGFFAMFVVLIPVGRLMNWLISYMAGVLDSGWFSPFLIVGSLMLIAAFAYTALVRIFSLPSELFERGLRWINGGQEVTGDSGSEQKTRMIMATFAQQANPAGRGALTPKMPQPQGGADQEPKDPKGATPDTKGDSGSPDRADAGSTGISTGISGTGSSGSSTGISGTGSTGSSTGSTGSGSSGTGSTGSK